MACRIASACPIHQLLERTMSRPGWMRSELCWGLSYHFPVQCADNQSRLPALRATPRCFQDIYCPKKIFIKSLLNSRFLWLRYMSGQHFKKNIAGSVLKVRLFDDIRPQIQRNSEILKRVLIWRVSH